ncbi:NH(3)-dependent NAD(+) synthetase [Roseibium hamelinense]|uniref:Glutamine-dependent NAD(+) synthetase n=1 Tax=Roseibium hamelinense TaxID=150831 RepID=A0A562T7S0_9HYPH|nr:NAD+ synthase [Roseibium hamelinense]MTI43541.1 NAD+ synthase [Roseibium hamelinense]TWI89665.1 NH(3)-dependent NAD(+) synthetase [Roseibium hamelinense]
MADSDTSSTASSAATPALDAHLRIAVAQLNPTVGNISANTDQVIEARAKAAAAGAHLMLCPELNIAGYPPEDLVLKSAFVERCKQAAERLARETADGGPGLIIGVPWRTEDGALYNAALLMDGGEIKAIRYKYDLPNYGVFDEKRVFDAGPLPGPVDFRGVRIGIPICEDIWNDEVCECLAETGAELLLVPNGSPYWANRAEERLQVVVARVVESDLPLIYCNQVAGQDELVFDGGSFALQADRTLAFQMPQFVADLGITDWRRTDDGPWICESGPKAVLPEIDEANWRACVLGLGDYVTKNGFPGVVLGLSGGIDSAVCAAMAVDALGADKVHAVMLPYRYTSDESKSDAAACADALGIRYDTVPIADPVEAFSSALEPLFAETQPDTTEENIQSRTRGVILMAISNKFGHMVVTTGNKSEMSVGYATLYGDMNGGYNPIKDLYKTQVYHLAGWRNKNHPDGMLGPKGEVIPSNIITKVPTAELRENQTDQDSLPPYDVLDDILEALVEDELSVAEIEKRGHDKVLINRIEHLLYIAEYKRRQAPPGVKITMKNFGKDRRYPITNRFRDR